MRPNMNTLDRSFRFLLAGIAAVLVLTDRVSGVTIPLLMMAGIAFLTSGLTGYCPVYAPFRFTTTRRK